MDPQDPPLNPPLDFQNVLKSVYSYSLWDAASLSSSEEYKTGLYFPAVYLSL